MPKSKKNYSAPALEKGLDIIELLSRSSAGFSQAEIAKELKRSVNEIYRMLNILVARNYIELDLDNDRYKLTFKLLQLSSQHQPIKNLMQKSLPMMREVAQLCNHSVHLSIYYAGKLLVIGQVDSPSSFNYSVTTGSNFDLLETSSGRVILAFQTVEERQRRLERRKLFMKLQKKKNNSSYNILEKKFSSKIIHEIIKNKCEVVKSLQVNGVTNISVPIFDHTNQAIAAVTIPFLQRIKKDALNDISLINTTKLLKDQALVLSKSLGFQS
jgi:DNA-binding IclR family transcriptional regulator